MTFSKFISIATIRSPLVLVEAFNKLFLSALPYQGLILLQKLWDTMARGGAQLESTIKVENEARSWG